MAAAAAGDSGNSAATPASAHEQGNFCGHAPGQCDLATIYRVIHLLEKLGMVNRFNFGRGAARFELADEGDDGHHHHLVYTCCAEVIEIEECFPSEVERRVAVANGFKNVTHKLDFFGICPECQ